MLTEVQPPKVLSTPFPMCWLCRLATSYVKYGDKFKLICPGELCDGVGDVRKWKGGNRFVIEDDYGK
jgi:hypothetical protein